MRKLTAIATIVACAVWLGLTLGAARPAPSVPAHVIVIDDDMGGVIPTYVRWWTRIRDSGVPVRFEGMCVSSCTIGLMLPKEQVCMAPTASFGFHLASDDKGEDVEFTRAIIRRFYPPVIQRWLLDKQLTLERIVFMSAKEAIALGVMKACD